jgi:hypothetical protein
MSLVRAVIWEQQRRGRCLLGIETGTIYHDTVQVFSCETNDKTCMMWVIHVRVLIAVDCRLLFVDCSWNLLVLGATLSAQTHTFDTKLVHLACMDTLLQVDTLPGSCHNRANTMLSMARNDGIESCYSSTAIGIGLLQHQHIFSTTLTKSQQENWGGPKILSMYYLQKNNHFHLRSKVENNNYHLPQQQEEP